MGAWLLRRVALIGPTLLLVSLLIFAMQQLLPGDPALALAGENQDPAVIAHIRQTYHLDRPIPVRYDYGLRGCFTAISASRSVSSAPSPI